MRIDIRPLSGIAVVLIGISTPFTLLAQEAVAASPASQLVQVDNTLLYALLALAVVQVIFILAMAGIMRTLGGPGAIANWLRGKKGSALLLLVLGMLTSTDASAQAYVGEAALSNYQVFWALACINAFLFVIILAQLTVLRGLTRAFTGADDRIIANKEIDGPSWVDNMLKKLTRQVDADKEEDILMHHEYDGIRELDNVLPPWWLWLFYGSIAFAVIYLVNVHVIGIMPDQHTEYEIEMAQSTADVMAYKATLKNVIDENNVIASVDPAVLSNGAAVFNEFCTPCHGADAAGSENSVGPNLTDRYWIHGGDATGIFKTIKYGIPEKGMISWKTQLKPNEIAALASYILSLGGTGPSTQKAPQGELWKAAPALTPADSAVVAGDSTKVASME